jgi:putative sigma-54 modulation protein
MRLELTGRHVRITPALREMVDDRLAKLDRILHDSAVSLQMVLSQEKHRHNAEMTLHARGENFLHGAGRGKDWDAALNACVEKINQQARKLKGKWVERKRRGVSPRSVRKSRVTELAPAPAADAQQVRIIRARRYLVKPMSVDEAALEVGEDRDAFIVFRNSTTDALNVLFRRPDGNLGLIEPEA